MDANAKLKSGYVYVANVSDPGVPERFMAIGPSMVWYANQLFRCVGELRINDEKCYMFERTDFAPHERFDRYWFQPACRTSLWSPLLLRSGLAGLSIITPRCDQEDL